MAQPVLDFWFDFSSPYSYPSAMRITQLARDAGVDVRFRPFLLGPLFKAQGWNTSPFVLFPAKGRYMWRDVERLCGDLGLPFRCPENFPQNSLLAARVALIGLSASWGEEFCCSVFGAQFNGGLQIDDQTVIADLLTGLRVDAGPVLEAAHSDSIKAQLRQETEQAQQLGIFGAPSFVAPDNELFWGNERLQRALAWTTAKREAGDRL